MPFTFRFDYPPEVVQARDEVYARVRELLAEQTWEAVYQARQLHLRWLEKYPEDYIALDAGEALVMAESAYRGSEELAMKTISGPKNAEVTIA